nr:MAG TPA: helix-turn-helix domain protein [Caudoviricetes sp.]
MNYRKITEQIRKYSPLEAYIFLGLSYYNLGKEIYPNIETLADKLHVDRKVVLRVLQAFQKNKMITITKKSFNGHIKNFYTISDDNYKLIDMQLLEEDIKREVKGFLVKLYCCTFNNDSYLTYTNKELAEILNLSVKRIEYYLPKCKDYIKIKKKGNKRIIEFIRKDIFIETRKSTIDMVKLIYPEILTDNDIYSRRIS